MVKVFMVIVVAISKIIGSWEKPLKQKILLLILTYAVAYPVLMYLPDAVRARNAPPWKLHSSWLVLYWCPPLSSICLNITPTKKSA